MFREGEVVRTPHLVGHVVVSNGHAPGRFGLVVSRKVGGAVVRNRVRRQLRAAIAGPGGLRNGAEAVFVFRGRPPVKTALLAEEVWKILGGVTAKGVGKGGS